MKKFLNIFLAGAFLSAMTLTAGIAQTTKSGAPVIPVPSGDVRKNAPKEGSAPKIQIGKAETSKLSNGLNVIVVENHKLPGFPSGFLSIMTPCWKKMPPGISI